RDADAQTLSGRTVSADANGPTDITFSMSVTVGAGAGGGTGGARATASAASARVATASVRLRARTLDMPKLTVSTRPTAKNPSKPAMAKGAVPSMTLMSCGRPSLRESGVVSTTMYHKPQITEIPKATHATCSVPVLTGVSSTIRPRRTMVKAM